MDKRDMKNITLKSNGKYQVRKTVNKIPYDRTFDTYEEAIIFRNGLTNPVPVIPAVDPIVVPVNPDVVVNSCSYIIPSNNSTLRILVDNDQFEHLNTFKWYITNGNVRNKEEGLLENFVYGEMEKGQKLRHINGNQLDNRIENLEIIDKITKIKTSKYVGVFRKHNLWYMEIRQNGGRKSEKFGNSDEEEIKAALRYNELSGTNINKID